MIILLAPVPVVAMPQSEAEPFVFDYPLTKGEIWLDSAYFSHWYILPDAALAHQWDSITEEDYVEVAAELGVEVPAIKAVVDIETGRTHQGFWKKGKALINFDLAMYRKYAPRNGVNLKSARKKHPVIFRSPDVRKYGSQQAAQYVRFDAASEISRAAAIEGCFWGMFQIGGFNWKLCGCRSAEEFYDRVNRSEREQLELFAAYCRARGLVKYIQKKDWAAFSLRYNGPGYKKRGYHKKMAEAYKKFKGR